MSRPKGRCFNCDEHVGGENFCRRCHTHVCNDCAVTRNIREPHDADQHLVQEETEA